MKRADLVLSVEVEGELAAVRSTEIGVPPVAEVDFKIAFLAPEGSAVKKGESVLRLDTEIARAPARREAGRAPGGAEEGRAEGDRPRHEAARPRAADRPGARPTSAGPSSRPRCRPRSSSGSSSRRRCLDKKGRERDLAEPRRRGPGHPGAHRRRARLAAPAARPRGGPGRRRSRTAIEKMNIKAPQDGIVVYRAELAGREEEGRRLGLVRRGGARAARPRGDEGRRLRGRGRRRPGARGADGDAAPRGALRLRPPRARWRRSAAPCASARGARRSRATGSRSRSRRRTRPSCGPRCASAARSRRGASPGVLLVPARRGLPARRGAGRLGAARALGWREVAVTLGRSNRTQVEVVVGPRRGRPGEPASTSRVPRSGRSRRAGGSRVDEARLAPRAPGPPRARSSPSAPRPARRSSGRRFVGTLEPRRASPPSRSARAASCARWRRAARLKAVKATPILVPAGVGPRSRRWRSSRKDGAVLKAGDTVVEFDPYDAQREAADGQADLTAARAKIDKAKAEGTKNEKLARPRPRRRQGGARPRGDLQADRREPLLAAPDHRVAARPRPLQPRRPTWPAASSTRAASSPRPSARSARSTRARRGSRSRSPRRACARCASWPPTTACWCSSGTGAARCPFVGDTLWPGQKIAEMPDLSQLEAKVFVLEADGAGLKAGQQRALRDRGPARARSTRPRVTRVEPLAKTRD